MEIKRCARCGRFFETEEQVCNNCIAKDDKDLGKLKEYFNEYGYSVNATKAEVSSNTGITLKNLNRFLLYKEFSETNVANEINIETSNKIETTV